MEGSSSEEYVSADEGPGGEDKEAIAPLPQSVNNGATDGPSEQNDEGKMERPTEEPSEPVSTQLPSEETNEPVSTQLPSEETSEPVSTQLPSPAKDISSSPPESVVSADPVHVVTPAVEAVLVPTEGPPVPPPRRKRKKKCEKQPSLENLAETEADPPRARAMTVGTTSLSRPIMLTCTTPQTNHHLGEGPSTPTTPPHPQLAADLAAHHPVVQESSTEERRESSQDPQQGTDQHSGRGTSLESNDSQTQDRVSSHSRSVTPTPAISIEPDLSLEWTADMLSLKESEVVTSDTSLAKARGSTATTTSSIGYPSDDDSLDGDAIFGGEDTPEEGGEGPTEPDHASNQPEQEASRSTSGADSDNAILESTMVKNLDTGEVIPLSAAEERIPQGHGWSPLSEHLLRRTKEIAEAEGQQGPYEDDYNPHRRKSRRKPFIKLKKWGKKRDRFHEDGAAQLDEATPSTEDRFAVKYKQAHHKQSQQEFDKVRLRQDLTGTHLGAIWSMEFSICGRLLATAGQDSVVRVWVLTTAALFFHELQAQYQRLGVHSSVDSLSEKASVASSSSKSSEEDDSQGGKLPFQEQPLCSYYGHTADVLDLSWSKNFFLLSSSMDKTVRLWHISRKECLCVFQHVDFVTAIAFHPRDDRYFLSGSLDGKLRLWNIPDKRVALWNEIEGVGSHLITAANFCMNGKLAVVGTYDGRCMFYDTEHLKYHTQIHVKSRHGKNKGRKISGVEPLPGEDKLLVTSNDSRVRLYNLKDHELSCKYKGCLNTSSQIKATFSRDGVYIISGSEDNFIYIWRTHMDVSKLSSARRDRNEFYECFTSHSAPVTTAVFAPVPGITVDEGIKEVGEMVVAADYQGAIKIYVSGEKL